MNRITSYFTFMALLAILATIFPFFNNFFSGYSIPIQLLIKAFNSYSSLTSVDTHNDNAQYKYGTYLN